MVKEPVKKRGGQTVVKGYLLPKRKSKYSDCSGQTATAVINQEVDCFNKACIDYKSVVENEIEPEG